MRTKSKYKGVARISLSDAAFEPSENKTTLDLEDVILRIFYTEKERDERDKKVSLDAMKEVTGGRGIVLTNSK